MLRNKHGVSMTNLDPLYSIRESRPFTGLGQTKTYEAIKAGKLRAVKIGARTLIPESAIRDFRDACPPAGRKPDTDQRAA